MMIADLIATKLNIITTGEDNKSTLNYLRLKQIQNQQLYISCKVTNDFLKENAQKAMYTPSISS